MDIKEFIVSFMTFISAFHCTAHCTIHCTLHCTLHSTVLFTVHCIAEAEKGWVNNFQYVLNLLLTLSVNIIFSRRDISVNIIFNQREGVSAEAERDIVSQNIFEVVFVFSCC